MMHKRLLTFIVSLILLGSGWGFTRGQDPILATSLEEGFKSPPKSARPRTWWHWTGGNVTKQGITADLEWMNRVGIAGFQLADVSFGMGQVIEEKIHFGSMEWLDAVQHAASEAKRLNLEMSIFSSAGWSLTGGPWVEPGQAMKKLVWSETQVSGPMSFTGEPELPPSGNGPIRNLYYGSRRSDREPDPTLYQDQVLLAYPRPGDEGGRLTQLPEIRMEKGPVDGAALLDGDLNTDFRVVPNADGSPVWLQYTFDQPYKAQSLTLASRAGIPFGRLLVSDDGIQYRTLVSLPGTQNYRGGKVRTFSFPAVEAKFFRLELSAAPLSPARYITQPPPEPLDTFALAEAILHSGARMHRYEEKAGFYPMNDYTSSRSLPVSEKGAIPEKEILDLSARMNSKGQLKWEVPEGNWTILRLGYSLTGAKNRPAVEAGLGFEVDKLNEDHTRKYIENYLRPIKKKLGPLFGTSLQYVLMDSWEAGMQNWTDDMIPEFTRRRSYDPRPYLPVLAGFIVEDAEVSERFLWDFRRTLADMFAGNHYGTITDYLHENGLGTYAEASGVSLEILEDALLCKKYVDIPMGEFWVNDLHPGSEYHVDVRGAASASHAYGKTLVAAESFTGGNFESPATLKRIADYWFTQGVNRLVFHTSAHQPNNSLPGNVMVGTHLHRNITWAEQAAPLMDYFSRTSYLLQEGLFVADLAYLLDEGVPSTMPFWGAGLQPPPPEGYDYDYVNSDILLNRMSVDSSGRITLPDGMNYAVLVLPLSGRMTAGVLRKIHELVRNGATVIGGRIKGSPSLADYPAGDLEIEQLSSDLWGDLDGITRTRNYYGRGTVVWGEAPGEVLRRMGISRDVEYGGGLDAGLSWIHRRKDDMDIYFLSSRNPDPSEVEVRFRTGNKNVELWHPDDGSIQSAPYTLEGKHTTVPLSLPSYGSVFVVFRDTSLFPSRGIFPVGETVLRQLDGAWDVRFREGLGAPGLIRLPELISWTDHENAGIKYFSGSANYVKSIKVPVTWLKRDTELILDLGEVKDLAEVSLNGEKIALLWKPPYRVNLTGKLREGDNELEITVYNQWSNRLLGDTQAEEGEKILDFNVRVMFDRPVLKESGLLGPVKIISIPKAPRDTVAGIYVNYDESKTGEYKLPGLFTLENGKPADDADTWLNQRRPEILEAFRENQYGHAPGIPENMVFDVFDRGTPAFEGRAIRKQVCVYFKGDTAGPKMDLLIYLPAGAEGPVPLLMNINFSPNSSYIDDPGIRRGTMWDREGKKVLAPEKSRFRSFDIAPFMERGIGIACIYYGDIEPDFPEGIKYGIRASYLETGKEQPEPNEWGAIASWAWGMSRAMDYLETDGDVDASKVAIFGVSRLGKTVMWAGASDPRFALVIASCSGEGGAALSRRNYGETIAHLTAHGRYPYQFCTNYKNFANDVKRFPVDAHMLAACIAPRPLLLQTGTTDYWSDPRGEFLAARAASPVYELLGAEGLGTDEMPLAGKPLMNTLGYFMHEGGHGPLPSDYEIFIEFLVKHLMH